MHPENPWRVGSANFTRLVDKALEYAGNVPSRQEIAAALLTRGYTTSDMDAYAAVTPQQVETPPAPVRQVVVNIPRIQPTIPLPPPPPAVIQPPIPIPAVQDARPRSKRQQWSQHQIPNGCGRYLSQQFSSKARPRKHSRTPYNALAT